MNINKTACLSFAVTMWPRRDRDHRPFAVLGIPHYDQAARILKFNLDRSVQGIHTWNSRPPFER